MIRMKISVGTEQLHCLESSVILITFQRNPLLGFSYQKETKQRERESFQSDLVLKIM